MGDFQNELHAFVYRCFLGRLKESLHFKIILKENMG